MVNVKLTYEWYEDYEEVLFNNEGLTHNKNNCPFGNNAGTVDTFLRIT